MHILACMWQIQSAFEVPGIVSMNFIHFCLCCPINQVIKRFFLHCFKLLVSPKCLKAKTRSISINRRAELWRYMPHFLSSFQSLQASHIPECRGSGPSHMGTATFSISDESIKIRVLGRSLWTASERVQYRWVWACLRIGASRNEKPRLVPWSSGRFCKFVEQCLIKKHLSVVLRSKVLPYPSCLPHSHWFHLEYYIPILSLASFLAREALIVHHIFALIIHHCSVCT